MNSAVHANLVARLRSEGASRADAEDCVQEALVEWLLRTSTNESLGDQLTWLATEASTRYRALTAQRAREIAVGLTSGYAADRAIEGPEEQVVQRAHARFLVSRLRRLPPVTQQICRLVARGADRSAMMRTLGLSARSVESHLTRARRLLRKHSALGWVALLAAAVVAAARRGPRLATTATAAVVSAGVVVLPVGDTPQHPDGPVTAAPRSAPPIPRGEAPPPQPPARTQENAQTPAEPTMDHRQGRAGDPRDKRPPRTRGRPVTVLDRLPARLPELPPAAVSTDVPDAPNAPDVVQFLQPAAPVESSVAGVSELVPQLVRPETPAPATVHKPGNAEP